MAFPRHRIARYALLVSLGATSLALASTYFMKPKTARGCGTESYRTRGVIKSFGPERKSVNIAHEKIEGYMAAMTMSFEPKTPEQLAGLIAGDKVSFSFTETDDGRRVLQSLKKE